MGTDMTVLGGKDVVPFVKDREPIFDEETGTFICGEQLHRGIICKGTPISPRWRCHRHGGDWKPTGKALASSNTESIYTVKGLWEGYHNIRQNLISNPELVDQLYTTDISEELAVARIVLANMLKKEGGKEITPAEQELHMQAIKLIARIAKTATEIQEKQSNVIKREFMDGIIAAVVHAFTRSNGYQRQSDRARIFVSEFASLLPGNIILDIPVPEDDSVVEGKKVARS